jgi:acetyltransferase-like isoleucine patch superfamily enzyme
MQKIITYSRQWAFGLLQFSLSIISHIPSQIIRNILYRHIYRVDMERGVTIYSGGTFFYPFWVRIGKYSILGNNFFIDGRRGVTIGENVNLSRGVSIYTLQHSSQDPGFGVEWWPVTIGDRVWLSANCTILPNITIGEWAIVAAGAVVTRDVEPYTIVWGVPAKKIGERTRDMKYSFESSGYIPFI